MTREIKFALGCLLIAAILAGVGCFMIPKAKAQDASQREFTLKMNNADLQVLEAAVNKAPLPREMTQPFINKLQAQIVEQSKPAAPADANGNPVEPKK